MRTATLAVAAMLVVSSAASAKQFPPNADQGAALLGARTAKSHDCAIASISCGQTVSGSITFHDCDIEDGNYADFWQFPGVTGQRVIIEANSTDVDPALFLLDAASEVRASDDDSGSDRNARIEFVLDFTEDWTISVINIFPFDFGNYTLSLACPSDPPPPNSPPLTSSQYPDFRFWVEIADTRLGTHGPSCLPETVCVAGAIPTRAEVFLRIVGPKPNGRLWPNIIKFNTTKAEVWIEQISTGIIKYYLLPNLGPESETLPGIVDKDGFVP